MPAWSGSTPIICGERIFLNVADGEIYITNESGLTSVFRAGPEFELLAENDLDDYVLSSIAISDGQIFLHTATYLYAIGTRARTGH